MVKRSFHLSLAPALILNHFAQAQIAPLQVPPDWPFRGIVPDSGKDHLLPTTSPTPLPSSAPSDYPSMVPSDFPSSMPSDAPSFVPSDAPSSIPSQVPSSFPSDMPSKIPVSWPEEEVPADLQSFTVCADKSSLESNGRDIVLEYTYDLQLADSSVDPTLVVAAMEQTLLEEVAEDMCHVGASRRGLFTATAFSPEPADQVIGTCGESCAVVQGKMTIKTSQEGGSLESDVYCDTKRAVSFAFEDSSFDSIEGLAGASFNVDNDQDTFVRCDLTTPDEPSGVTRDESPAAADSKRGEMRVGAIIGITLGSIFLAIILCWVLCCCKSRRRERGRHGGVADSEDQEDYLAEFANEEEDDSVFRLLQGVDSYRQVD